jgi:ubiquinone/menaquinone biosynthesis C-methylase UbiE
MSGLDEIERYVRSSASGFWKEILRKEAEYLLRHLEGCKDVLSVGCGPAIIEGALSERGIRVTGLDISREALRHAPHGVRTVLASAEDMPFPDSSFDAVIYVVSLQFIEDYRKAMRETFRVLRPDGRLIGMLLNPESAFFKEKRRDPRSYVHGIKHAGTKDIEDAITRKFSVHTEYFLGAKAGAASEERDADEMLLYIVAGTKRPAEKE